MTNPNLNPEWIWGIGIIVLGIVIAYTMARAKRPRDKQAAADEATRRNFDSK